MARCEIGHCRRALAASRALLLGCFVLVASGVASAQHSDVLDALREPAGRSRPSEADLEEARARFAAGQAAIEAGRWADALENFLRAYVLTGASSALYNVGVSLRALGRYWEAREVFDRLLRWHGDRLRGERKRLARQYLQEAASRVATLTLEGLEPSARYEIRLDGAAVDDDGQRPLRIEANPGRHTLVVEREGYEPFEWSDSLRDGQHATVRVLLRPVPRPLAPAPETRTERSEEQGGGIFTSPWFWVGTATVALGGAAVAAYFLGVREGPLEPHSDRVIRLPAP